MDKKFVLGLVLFLGGILLYGLLATATMIVSFGHEMDIFSLLLIVAGLVLSISRAYRG